MGRRSKNRTKRHKSRVKRKSYAAYRKRSRKISKKRSKKYRSKRRYLRGGAQAQAQAPDPVHGEWQGHHMVLRAGLEKNHPQAQMEEYTRLAAGREALDIIAKQLGLGLAELAELTTEAFMDALERIDMTTMERLRLKKKHSEMHRPSHPEPITGNQGGLDYNKDPSGDLENCPMSDLIVLAAHGGPTDPPSLCKVPQNLDVYMKIPGGESGIVFPSGKKGNIGPDIYTRVYSGKRGALVENYSLTFKLDWAANPNDPLDRDAGLRDPKFASFGGICSPDALQRQQDLPSSYMPPIGWERPPVKYSSEGSDIQPDGWVSYAHDTVRGKISPEDKGVRILPFPATEWPDRSPVWHRDTGGRAGMKDLTLRSSMKPAGLWDKLVESAIGDLVDLCTDLSLEVQAGPQNEKYSLEPLIRRGGHTDLEVSPQEDAAVLSAHLLESMATEGLPKHMSQESANAIYWFNCRMANKHRAITEGVGKTATSQFIKFIGRRVFLDTRMSTILSFNDDQYIPRKDMIDHPDGWDLASILKIISDKLPEGERRCVVCEFCRGYGNTSTANYKPESDVLEERDMTDLSKLLYECGPDGVAEGMPPKQQWGVKSFLGRYQSRPLTGWRPENDSLDFRPFPDKDMVSGWVIPDSFFEGDMTYTKEGGSNTLTNTRSLAAKSLMNIFGDIVEALGPVFEAYPDPGSGEYRMESTSSGPDAQRLAAQIAEPSTWQEGVDEMKEEIKGRPRANGPNRSLTCDGKEIEFVEARDFGTIIANLVDVEAVRVDPPTVDGVIKNHKAMKGNIAVFIRGGAAFIDVARAVQAAGACGMICANTDEDIVEMSHSGGNDYIRVTDVTIPCVMIKSSDLDLFGTIRAYNTRVSLTYAPDPFNMGPVFYYNQVKNALENGLPILPQEVCFILKAYSEHLAGQLLASGPAPATNVFDQTDDEFLRDFD